MNNRVLDGPIESGCFVHIIHGLKDKEVPVKLVDKLAQLLPANQTERTQVPEGDHRLSRPEDIELILKSLESLLAKVDV
jgi:pimeloyl-ACP methyl ester carboxylesterase